MMGLFVINLLRDSLGTGVVALRTNCLLDGADEIMSTKLLTISF